MQKNKLNLAEAQLFIDNTWIEDSIRVERVFHQPRKYPEPVLKPDRPHEHWACVGYGTVLFRDNLFHLWYVTWPRDSAMTVCYAVSADGVIFEKPSLGIYDFKGSKDNNICIMLDAPGIIDGISVIEDPDDDEWPLKAILYQGRMPKPELNGLAACRSKDGIHWDMKPGLVLPGYGDRTNAMPAKVNGKFVALTRIPRAPDDRYGSCRMVWRIESEDLVHWSKPELIFKQALEDKPQLEMYSATAFKYESLYLGFIERMHMRPDKLDSELTFSRDSHAWHRTHPRNVFIPWGADGAFDSVWLSMLSNGPINFKKSLWLYYSGRTAAHNCPEPLNHGAIGLAIMRQDGFASLHGSHRPGWVLTPPFEWTGGDLLVNADPRSDLSGHPFNTAHGAIQVEARDAGNKPMPGYEQLNCLPIRNTLSAPMSRAPVTWKENKSARALAGKTIRLAFYLQDAHLYSFLAGGQAK